MIRKRARTYPRAYFMDGEDKYTTTTLPACPYYLLANGVDKP